MTRAKERLPAISSKAIPTIDWLQTVGPWRAIFTDRRENLVLACLATENISQIHVTGAPIIIVNSPDYAYELLVAKAGSFHSGKPKEGINRLMFGNGLVIREGEQHKQSRKEINPAFDRGHLTIYGNIIADCAERAQARWHDGATIDIKQEMDRLMFDILGWTFFSKDFLGEDRAAGDVLLGMATTAFGVTPSPFQAWLDRFTGRYKNVVRAISNVDRLITNFIGERGAGSGDHNDLLGGLMKSTAENGEPLSDEDLRDAVMGLIAGAYATTSNALIWMWHLLAKHPDAQSKIAAEADENLKGAQPRHEDLAKLPYALQVFKESQRLFPLGSTISRCAIEDVEIDGYVIPKGALICASTYAMHRNPAVFPDPESFRPERFAPDAERAMPRNAYMPFSIGPRLCIGRHFAQLAGQVSAATISQRLSLVPVGGSSDLVPPRLLRAGVKLLVKRRETHATAPLAANGAGKQRYVQNHHDNAENIASR